MAYDRKPNSGFFGKNKKKNSERAPDYTGSILIGEDTLGALMAMKASGKPVTLYLSGWKRTPQGGGDAYISLACNAGMQQQGSKAPAPKKPTQQPDEDIPF